jgi:hypothetical protein
MSDEIPADVTKVWGTDPIGLALFLTWGEEAFRDSELHQVALMEAAREPARASLRAAFVKEHAKKKQVDDVIPEPEEIK